jgi:hypothetical protein
LTVYEFIVRTVIYISIPLFIYLGADQGLLNYIFSSWHSEDLGFSLLDDGSLLRRSISCGHLSYSHNACISPYMDVSTFHSNPSSTTYISCLAYKQFKHQIKVVHFLGRSNKPWLAKSSPYPTLDNYWTLPVSGLVLSPSMNEYIDLWWSFYNNIFGECKGSSNPSPTLSSVVAMTPSFQEIQLSSEHCEEIKKEHLSVPINEHSLSSDALPSDRLLTDYRISWPGSIDRYFDAIQSLQHTL